MSRGLVNERSEWEFNENDLQLKYLVLKLEDIKVFLSEDERKMLWTLVKTIIKKHDAKKAMDE